MAHDLPWLKLCSSAEQFEVEGKKDEGSNEVKHLEMLLFNETYSWILFQQQEIKVGSKDAGL